MGLGQHAFGGNTLGGKTAAGGTVIRHIVPPNARGFSRVSTLKATAAATAHALTAMRPIGETTVASTAAAGQAVVNLTAQPGPTGNGIASGDILAIRRTADGITRIYIVDSVSTLAITMTANLGTGLGLAAGDKVWFFGVPADTDPTTGDAHPAFTIAAGAQTTLTDDVGGVIASHEHDQPIVLSDNNATNAGSIDQVSYSYTID